MKSQQDLDHTLLMMLLGAFIYLVVQCAFLQKAFKQFQEEAALIAHLTAHRKLTAQGVAKTDALSAKLSGIRLQLTEERI